MHDRVPTLAAFAPAPPARSARALPTTLRDFYLGLMLLALGTFLWVLCGLAQFFLPPVGEGNVLFLFSVESTGATLTRVGVIFGAWSGPTLRRLQAPSRSFQHPPSSFFQASAVPPPSPWKFPKPSLRDRTCSPLTALCPSV